MPIASIAVVFLREGGIWGRLRFRRCTRSRETEGCRRLSVARPSVGCFLSRRRDEYNIKTSKNASEPAKLFLAITRERERPLYVLSEEIDRGVLSDILPTAMRIQGRQEWRKVRDRRYFFTFDSVSQRDVKRGAAHRLRMTRDKVSP